MRRQIFLLAIIVLLLAGCSTLGLGSSDYSCKGYPETVNCKSAREVYDLTNYRDSLEKPKGAKADDCPECEQTVPVTLAQYPSPAAASSTAVQGLGYAGPMPLRSAARIMRVWVAPWESMDGALHLPTYLYAEVEERRWSIGERKMEVAPQITPLLDQSIPDSPSRTQRKPAKAQTKGQKPKCELTLPKENPHPAPTLDTTIKSKNAPQQSFFNRKTGQVKKDNLSDPDL